jgi:hypothetical protein
MIATKENYMRVRKRDRERVRDGRETGEWMSVSDWKRVCLRGNLNTQGNKGGWMET